MKRLLLSALFISGAISFATGQVAYTSFEEPVVAGQYTDTGDAGVAHDLINNAGESEVDFTSAGTEMGFDARYEPYDTPDVGLTDGDFVGATDFTGDVGAYTDGVQGYQMSDTDGNMILEFDVVDFSGFTSNSVSLDYFINATGYEGDGTLNESGSDRMRIYVKDLTNSTEIDLLNTEGSDINDLAIEGTWNTATAVIPDGINAQLVVEVRTNAGSEALYLDNIVFNGTALPTFSFTITEIFSGQEGTDLTEDWFEIENTGTTTWVSGVDPDLYYDDDSADPSAADVIQGLTDLAPGEHAIILITGNSGDITTFTDVWSPVIDLTGVEIGYADGSGLGGGGDAVTLWVGDPTASAPVDNASYPDTAANDGQSYDVDLGEFSVVGNANGAVETFALGGDNNDVPNIGSPGNGPAVLQAQIAFDAAFASVSEDAGSITINVTPTLAPSVEGTVEVALIMGGTAVEGTHFTYSATETLTFPVGSATAQTVTIPILDNTTDDSDVFFVLELQNESNIEVGGEDLFSVYILDDDTVVPSGDASQLDISLVTSYLVDPNGTAEISAYDPATQRVFVTNGDKIEVLDFSDPSNVFPVATVNVSDFGAESVQSVAVANGMVAAALSVDPKTDNGLVVIADADGNNPTLLEVGALPDMLTFSPDGNLLVVANEGEPNADYSIDPEGSISVIDVSGGIGNISQANVTTLNFNAFDAQIATLRAAGVRIYGPGASVSQDLEPEYVAISDDSQTAYVSLQENNAYAIVDLVNLTITDIKSFGLKNHALPDNSLDVSDETDFVFNASWPIRGMYMPDAIAFYEVGGIPYLVTANEGDAREYDTFEEERKIDDNDYVLDPTVFQNIDILELESNLSEIAVTMASGDLDNDGDFDEIHVFGGRSFSIFNANTGLLVYDSGNDFEVITANDPTYGAIFNASNSSNDYKNRSDNKGPEPEGVLVKEINGEIYAFVLLERIGGMMVYNISDPNAPQFLSYENNRDATPGGTESGDLGPEGVFYVSPADSPTEKGLIVISNEVSATLSVYELGNDILSVQDFGLADTNSFAIYPNPANSRVYFSKPGNYTLYDITGRLITSKKEAVSLNITTLSEGVYVIVNENGASQKLIVE
ncbi:MAG: hypothetical protein CMC74_09230 [Flavobacteriaceae bacterium]|nr:hypothetical protein [Flavobacteriaceae bacterium]|tara:strand:+ start:831 stop:4172 length:3342 start_codon:yes stop_codon:yes gene_type:complete